jgi:hypothetical protein
MEFAEIDNNGVVLRVIVVSEEDATTEEVGSSFCVTLTGGGKWVASGEPWQRNMAAIGYTYNAYNKTFIPPQPYPSWTFVNNIEWQPPIPMPDDGLEYIWNEDTKMWEKVDY